MIGFVPGEQIGGQIDKAEINWQLLLDHSYSEVARTFCL